MTGLIVFFLSPRVIDLDTYLPTAVQLREVLPDREIRFVTFSNENYRFIRRNPTLMAGIERCGSLLLLGSDGERHLTTRLMKRLTTLLCVSAWILRCRRPVLFLGIPFTRFPYALWYLLSKLRGGWSYMLWKVRSPDISQEIIRAVRKVPPPPVAPSLISRLLGRNLDGLVCYHGKQDRNIEWTSGYGDVSRASRIEIGMPHLFPAWRSLIDSETARARRVLVEAGVAPDAEIFCMFPAKVLSSETLRADNSITYAFAKAGETLHRLRPRALILVRPHPLAVDEPYVHEFIEKLGGAARISFEHPEVLISISRRAIFNNPTNIMFSCFPGRLIDVSDYSEYQYQRFGTNSLGAGYGPVFIDPRSEDFEARFEALLDDDAFDRQQDRSLADELLARWPPDIGKLARWIEHGPASAG